MRRQTVRNDRQLDTKGKVPPGGGYDGRDSLADLPLMAASEVSDLFFGLPDAAQERDEQHVADLEERFRLVRLLTPEALDLESRRMHHCVGHGSYDEGVASGDTEIYSMRDPQGRPVITMEVYVDIYDDGARRLQQVKGKRNNDPEDWQADILQKWLQTSGWGNLEFHFDVVADNDCRPDRGLSWCRPDHCDGP
jgi:hypothetical protein